MDWSLAGELMIKGVLLGIGIAVPLGPVNVQVARRALMSGFLPAAALGMGAVTVDVCYALAAALGARILTLSPWIFWPLALGGTLLLGWMGVGCLGNVRTDSRKLLKAEGVIHRPLPSYLAGLALTGLSPMTLAFWFIVVPGLAMDITPDASPAKPSAGVGWLCAGVFLGTTAWVICFSGLMSFFGKWRKPWWISAANDLGGCVLLMFAAATFLQAVSRALS